MPSKPGAADLSIDLDPCRVARDRGQANEIAIALDLNLPSRMPFQRSEYEAQADLEIIADFAVAEDQEAVVHPSSSQLGAHRFFSNVRGLQPAHDLAEAQFRRKLLDTIG